MLARARASVIAVIGADELLVLVGLCLLTGGLWSIVDRAALMAPGLILLWVGLPQRTTFLTQADSKRPKGGD